MESILHKEICRCRWKHVSGASYLHWTWPWPEDWLCVLTLDLCVSWLTATDLPDDLGSLLTLAAIPGLVLLCPPCSDSPGQAIDRKVPLVTAMLSHFVPAPCKQLAFATSWHLPYFLLESYFLENTHVADTISKSTRIFLASHSELTKTKCDVPVCHLFLLFQGFLEFLIHLFL